MPVVIKARCFNCHVEKERLTEFPNRVIGRSPEGKPKRAWSVYCHACLKASPALYKDAWSNVQPPFESGDSAGRSTPV